VRFFRHVLSTFLAEIAIVGLNLLLGVLTARVLGPERRGILALVMTLPVTLVTFADLGISRANIYLIGRRGRSPQQIASNALFFALATGAFLGLGLWPVRGLALRTLLRGLPARYLALILVLTPFLLLYTHWLAILRAFQRFELFNLIRLLMPLSLLGMMGAALLVFHGGIGWATAAYGAGVLLAVGISLAIVGAITRPRLRFDRSLAGEAMAYGLKSYLQNLVSHLTYRLDLYLVAYFLSPREVAFYAIATSAAELAWYIPNSVGLVLFPKLSATEEERIHPLTAEISRHTLLITLLAAGVVLLAGGVGIPLLYGADYRPAVGPMVILMPGVATMALYKVLSRNFSSRNRQEVSIAAAALGLALDVLLNVIFIPRLRVMGAALASTIAYSLAALVLLEAFRRESGLSREAVLRLRQDDLQRYAELVATVRAVLGRWPTADGRWPTADGRRPTADRRWPTVD